MQIDKQYSCDPGWELVAGTAKDKPVCRKEINGFKGITNDGGAPGDYINNFGNGLYHPQYIIGPAKESQD